MVLKRLDTSSETNIRVNAGSYAQSGLEPVEYELAVAAEGYVGHVETFSIQLGAPITKDIALTSATNRISGKVTDPDGKLIQNASMVLKRLDTASETNIKVSAGSYAQSGLEPAEYELTVAAERFVRHREVINIPLGAPVAKDIVLEAAQLTGGPGVYFLESKNDYDTYAKVWKDGTEFRLDNASSANSLFVTNDDVYVAGSSKGESYEWATLWKNGTPTQLDTVASTATAVFVSGNDVYVAGTIGAAEARRPALWKNGERKELSKTRGDKSWVPSHVSVWGKDVYVGGSTLSNNAPVLWRNGEESLIPLNYPDRRDRSGRPVPIDYWQSSDLAVSGGDLYVRGSINSDSYLWKNGQMQKLSNGNNYPSVASFFVTGKDVYVLGGGLWKNGVRQNLELFENPESLQVIPSYAHYVFVSSADVYVFGRRDKYSAGGIDYPQVYVIRKHGKTELLAQPRYNGYSFNINDFFVVK
jgi:hypothetical protein